MACSPGHRGCTRVRRSARRLRFQQLEQLERRVLGGSSGGKTYTMTLDLGVEGCPFCYAVQHGAEDEAAKEGVKFNTVAPTKADPALQIQGLSAVLAAKPDFLLIQPDDGQALIATVKQFNSAGIPVMTVDTDVNDKSLRLGTVTSDNYAGGVLAADQLNKLLHGHGQVAYIGYVPGASTTDDRQKGFETELKKYPGLQYVGAQYTQDDNTEAASKMSAVLQRYPNLAGIFGGDEANAIGSGIALKQAGKQGKVKLVAFDGAPDEVAALKAGNASMLIVQNAYGMGQAAVKQAVAYLKDGTKPPAMTNPKYVIVTNANVDSAAVKPYLYPNS